MDKEHKNECLCEYRELRAEMLQKIEMCNTLLTFMYTCTVTILGVSASIQNPFVSLIPLLIIIPTSSRIAYYRESSAKMAAYQIVFIETELDGIRWEGRNARVNDYVGRAKCGCRFKIFSDFRNACGGVSKALHYYDFPILCGICLLMFLLFGGANDGPGVAVSTASAIVTFAEFILSHVNRSMRDARNMWVLYWSRIKIEEEEGSASSSV